MYAIAFVILLPLLGLWLIRTTRSYERLAVAVNENNVDLGFLSFKGKANVFLLFSDPTFVLWLVRRKYEGREYPQPVVEALEEARRSYLMVMVGFAAFLLILVGLKFAVSR